jgi:outer membrane protein TolC
MIFLRSNAVRKTLLILSLLLVTAWLAALTQEEAKQLALQNNPKYQAQLNSYQSARWSSQQTFSNLLPSLSLSGSYIYLDPATSFSAGMTTQTMNHDMRSLSLSLSQPVFMGGKLWQAYKITKASEELSRLSLESTRLSILAEVETKYLSVLQLTELLNISSKDLQSSQQNLAIAQIRFDGGTLSYHDLLKIKGKAATKEVALIQSQTALELAKQDFSNFLSLTEWTDLQPVALADDNSLIQSMLSWDAEATASFTGKANAVAMQHNLGLKSAAQAVILSKRAYRIAKGTFMPTVVLSASRAFSENGFDRYEFNGKNTVALTASLPILPFWGNYSATKKAYYDVQKSSLDYRSAGDGINLAVKASALNLVSSARQINASRIALEYTQQTYEQLMERFRNNMLSATDILDAEVMLQAAQVNLTNSTYAWLKAKTALLQSLGTDDKTVLNTITE